MGSVSATADRGGFTAANDQYIGIQPEQLPMLIAAATAPLERQNAAQREEIRNLSGRLGTSEGIVRATLASLGPHIDDLSLEALPAKVAELARERQELHDRQRDRPAEADARLEELNLEIERSLATGADDKARELLILKRDLKRAAATRRREAADRLRDAEARDLRDAAESESMLGDLARARLDYRAAAEHFAAAADLIAAVDPILRLDYLKREFSALHDQGNEFGDNAALRLAIERSRILLTFHPRERVPLQWATTQNNLGTALWTLGEREPGAARLEEAVAAYRDALVERTRERVPLDWAMTQSNLGNALATLGQRQSGTARLEEAVAAYRDALLECTRDRVPLDWANTRLSSGKALLVLFERTPDAGLLDAAESAFGDARQVYIVEAGQIQHTGYLNDCLAQVATLRAQHLGGTVSGHLEPSGRAGG